MNRTPTLYQFFKYWLSILAILSPISALYATPTLAKPSAKQLRFADWEIGAFFHYNLTPFTGQENGDGQEPPSKFNPTELDIDQWLTTAKSMGARYAVFTARHEGGFCLWPTKTTDYSIANSPYQRGKGDLVREFTEACRRHGLAVGIYHTANYDAHQALHNYKGPINSPLKRGSTWESTVEKAMKAGGSAHRKRFNDIQVAQVRELLTQYGKIDFMWSDHWDASKPENIWRAVTDLAQEIQPNMILMGPDTWTPGNQSGHVIYPMWNAVDTVDSTKYTRPTNRKKYSEYRINENLSNTKIYQGHPFGKFWRARECPTYSAFHKGGWLWHSDKAKEIAPKKTWEHIDLYHRTVGLGANVLINLPLNTKGLIPEDIVAAAQNFGDEIRSRFKSPIASINKVQKGNIVELKWDKMRSINTIVTMENIANGQKINKYTLEAFVRGKWIPLKQKNRIVAALPYNSSPGFLTVGHKKIDSISTVITNRIRFRCLEAVAEPVEILSFAAYRCRPNKRVFDASYPYLSGIDTAFNQCHGGLLRDKDYRGGPLQINGRTFKHGLLTCPVKENSRGVAEFDLRHYRKVKGLKATIGIEDMVGNKGSCVFLVEAQINGKWSSIYQSPRLTGRDLGRNIEVDFPINTKRIRLVAFAGRDGIHNDHAVWGNVRFVE